MEENKKACCSFCKQEASEELVLFKGFQNVFICSECIKICMGAVNDKEKAEKIEDEKEKTNKIYKPSQIKKHLDEYVIGQDHAKEILAVSVYNHYKMLECAKNKDSVELEKSNVLIIGATGTGKTHMLKTLAKFIDVPLAIADATSITEAGYVGDDVENILLKLIRSADGDIKKAQRGIIYIDEIDKIRRSGENMSITKDVGGEGVQQAILKMVEGAVVDVPPQGGRKNPGQSCIQFDTTNILFVIGGSFEGIEKIISKRKTKNSMMGFGGEISKKGIVDTKLINETTVEDLKKFGMIPELLGRFPVIATLEELSLEALRSILVEPKNALVKQYQKLFEMDSIELIFEDEALDEIAKLAKERKTGARALRGIMEDVLHKYMFSLPDDSSISRVIISADTVVNKKEPLMIRVC